MWEAIDALCVILIDLGEFTAVRSLIDAVMPQVCATLTLTLISKNSDHQGETKEDDRDGRN